MKYDIVIVATNKDFHKIKYVYESIIKNIKPMYNKIYCFCPEYPVDRIENIHYILDKDILDINISNIMFNPTWIYQQYLKLLQNITLDNYLIIDADIIINRAINIFNDKPNFILGTNINSKSFFEYSKLMFDIVREYDYSFINDIMLFDRNIIKEMILTKFNNIEDFIKKSNNIITNKCFISEYELYGNYVYKNHKNDYNYIKLKTLKNYDQNDWTPEYIEKYIEKYKDSNIDILMIPTLNK